MRNAVIAKFFYKYIRSAYKLNFKFPHKQGVCLINVLLFVRILQILFTNG